MDERIEMDERQLLRYAEQLYRAGRVPHPNHERPRLPNQHASIVFDEMVTLMDSDEARNRLQAFVERCGPGGSGVPQAGSDPGDLEAGDRIYGHGGSPVTVAAVASYDSLPPVQPPSCVDRARGAVWSELIGRIDDVLTEETD